jgi:LysM repeat protein
MTPEELAAALMMTEGRHVVRPGDTMSEIARDRGFPLQRMFDLNQGVNPRALQPGQELMLPQQLMPRDEIPVKPFPESGGYQGPPYAWGGGEAGTISGEQAVTPRDAPPMPARNPDRVEEDLFLQPASFTPESEDALAKTREELNGALSIAGMLSPVGRVFAGVKGMAGITREAARQADEALSPSQWRRLNQQRARPYREPAERPFRGDGPWGREPVDYRGIHRNARRENRRERDTAPYSPEEQARVQAQALARRLELDRQQRTIDQLFRKGTLDEGTGRLVGP